MSKGANLGRCTCGAKITATNQPQNHKVEEHVIGGQVTTSYIITGCNTCLKMQPSNNGNTNTQK